MFTYKFDLESQKDRYNKVKDKIKNKDFYQRLNFYVLPFMPEKFRSRVVFLPEKCEPEKIYNKQKLKIKRLKTDWEKSEKKFVSSLDSYFPELDTINIEINLSLYGTTGSYKLTEDKIYIYPRYDRNVNQIQDLLIVALTHFF